MVRNILGSLLALIGAAAAVLSPFRPWYDGREGSDYPVTDLFNGISGNGSAVVVSVALPFLFAAVVTLFGVVLRSRALVGLAGLAVLGFTVLWMVRQGQSADGLGVSANGTGLGTGIAYAAGGGIVLLLAALVMSGRRHRARRRSPEPQYDYEAPYQQQYPPPYQPPYEQQYGPPQYESQQYEQPQYQPPYEPRHRHDPYGYQPYAYEPQPPPSSPPEEWSRHDGDTQSLPRVTDEPWSPSSTPPQGPPPEKPPDAPRPR